MTLRGKGINLQVLTECICYLLFGYLLFQLTYSGGYLNYVTPRMKPYLYGMSALMFLWAVFTGRYLLTPPVSGKAGPFFCFYYSDSAACLPSGRSWGEQYGQKL